MSDTAASDTAIEPVPKPKSDAPSGASPETLFDRLARRLSDWGQYLATTLIVDSFLLFESTVDLRVYGLEKLLEVKRAGGNPLLVIWHGQGLLTMATFRHERLCLYASHTREDNYPRPLLILRWWTLRFIERLGYKVLDAAQFASESRGVMQFVDLLRGGTGSVIAADGPAGPIYKAKAGPTFLAKKSGVTLIPLGAAISNGFQLDQWDRFEVPYPFAKAVIVVGDPIVVPPKGKDGALEAARLALETEMNMRMAEALARLTGTAASNAALESEVVQQVQREGAQRDQQQRNENQIEQEQPGR